MLKGETEALMMMAATEIWKRSYGSGKDQAYALQMVHEQVQAMQDGGPEDIPRTDMFRLVHAVEWVHHGCVTLTTSHKFAAALGATRVADEEVLLDLELPAKAFRVEIPQGILCNQEHELDYTQANIVVLDDGTTMFALEGRGPLGEHLERRLSCLPMTAPTVSKALVDDDDEMEWRTSEVAERQIGKSALEIRQRMFRTARRIVAGLLIEFGTTFNPSQQQRAHTTRGDGREPPKHRTIYIGKPMQLDARPALSNYLGGNTAMPPSVQSLVRGHYKRQVIGVSRSGRKVIWVEPYWRGPEDAPILARPYRVGPKDDATH